MLLDSLILIREVTIIFQSLGRLDSNLQILRRYHLTMFQDYQPIKKFIICEIFYEIFQLSSVLELLSKIKSSLNNSFV